MNIKRNLSFSSALVQICLMVLLGITISMNGWADAPFSVDNQMEISVGCLNLPRIAAGCPAGWRLEGNNYRWEIEKKSGPLGTGSARITFDGKGELKIISPAHFMESQQSYSLSLWTRSTNDSAVVRIKICDNDTEQSVLFDENYPCSNEWRQLSLEGVLPGAVRDCYYLVLAANGQDCTLWLDGLLFQKTSLHGNTTESIRQYPAMVTLNPRAPWGLVTGSEPFRISAVVVGVNQSQCQLRLVARHTNGKSEIMPPMDLDDSGIWQGQFELTGELAQYYGMIRLEATVVDRNGCELSPMSETLLARAPQPMPGLRPDSPFGVHICLNEPDLSVVKKLGFQWCRIHDASCITKWAYVEPQQGQWTWFDDQVQTVRDHGLCILGMLDSAPVWESQSANTGYFSIYGAPKHIDKWSRYVQETVRHYAGKIDAWEVWNEPWNMLPEGFFQGGSPALYAQLLKSAYQEAKAANPKCTIVGINTLPAFWDQAVMSYNVINDYDRLSWHLYDSKLQAHPNDTIHKMTNRLEREQQKYGTPKPQMCTEAGPGLSIRQGSFFSFANPALSGDWSYGADQLVRMYLGAISQSVRQIFLYSMHNNCRYGKSSYQTVETGPLLRPMNLTLAALAHFVEGAQFQTCIKPSPDISAYIFKHAETPPFASAPCTVAVVVADGQDHQELPVALPKETTCYDRWGNLTGIPDQASRGPVYLVACGAAGQSALVNALQPKKDVPFDSEPINGSPAALVEATLSSLTYSPANFWKLFSSFESLAVIAGSNEVFFARRSELKTQNHILKQLDLPEEAVLAGREIVNDNQFAMGWFTIRYAAGPQAPREWLAMFTAAPDGRANSWRYLSLVLVPCNPDGFSRAMDQPSAILERWRKTLVEGNKLSLHDTMDPTRFIGTLPAFLSNSIETFCNPHAFLTVLQESLSHGIAANCELSATRQMTQGNLAVCFGDLKFLMPAASPMLGTNTFAFSAAFLYENNNWKLVSISFYPRREKTS